MRRKIINRSLCFNGALLAFFLLAFVLPLNEGCRESAPSDKVKYHYAIDTTFIRGPVSFRVACNKKELTIAEHLKLLLELRARSGYRAELPSFGEKLYQFGIVDYRNYPPYIEKDSTVVTRREYELEPFLSGIYKIEPMTVRFWQEGDTTTHYMSSDTIKVIVNSLLPSDVEELEIKDISPPFAFPSNRRVILVVFASVVLIGVILYMVLSRRRKGERVAPQLPAHEIAFRRLESLLSSGLLEQNRYREFTEEVSDILRYYIEDRFGLRAPERTTEEFLEEARDGLPVDKEKKEMLAEFLSYCDLVKFAALEPSPDDVKRLFESCRDFIDATREVEAAA